MLLELPRFKCKVEAEFLTGGQESGWLNAYCFAVTLLEAKPLLFTLHLEDGAIYSRVPIWKLRHELLPLAPLSINEDDLDTWGAISSNGGVVSFNYLKDYHVKVALPSGSFSGLYRFTIDYFSGGFAEDPEQHKTSNIIALETGHFCAVPNNYCHFVDEHFTDLSLIHHYKRQRKYLTLRG